LLIFKHTLTKQKINNEGNTKHGDITFRIMTPNIIALSITIKNATFGKMKSSKAIMIGAYAECLN